MIVSYPGKLPDEVVGVGGLGGLDDFFLASLDIPVSDVIFYRVVKENWSCCVTMAIWPRRDSTVTFRISWPSMSSRPAETS